MSAVNLPHRLEVRDAQYEADGIEDVGLARSILSVEVARRREISRKSRQRDAEEQSNAAETHEPSAVIADVREAGQRYPPSFCGGSGPDASTLVLPASHSHCVEALVPA